jgi:hypothetical protein
MTYLFNLIRRPEKRGHNLKTTVESRSPFHQILTYFQIFKQSLTKPNSKMTCVSQNFQTFYRSKEETNTSLCHAFSLKFHKFTIL